MDVTFTERVSSRTVTTGPNPSRAFRYTLTGAQDDIAARAAVEASTALTYDNLYRQTIELEPIDSGAGVWAVTVRYGKKPDPAPGSNTTSFDTGGGTMHVTQSKGGTIWDPTASGAPPAPDPHNAIGVSYEGMNVHVAGVDVTVPVYSWTETHQISDADVQSHKASYYGLTGKTNSATFRGFAAGEVLFQGASGTTRGNNLWEITFKFAASPNRTGVTEIPGFTFDKKGWEYLWVMYGTARDPDCNRLTKVPIGVYTSIVYDSGDYSGLGIGS